MVLSTTKEEINMSSHKDAVSQIVDTLNKSAAKPKLDMQVKEQFLDDARKWNIEIFKAKNTNLGFKYFLIKRIIPRKVLAWFSFNNSYNVRGHEMNSKYKITVVERNERVWTFNIALASDPKGGSFNIAVSKGLLK